MDRISVYVWTIMSAISTGILYIGVRSLDFNVAEIVLTVGVFALCAVFALGAVINSYIETNYEPETN